MTAAKPKRKSVKVLDHLIKLQWVDEKAWGNEAYADFDTEKHLIRIRKDLPPTMEGTTLAHELVHVYQHIYGLDMSEMEANRLGLFIYSLFINNKDLFK